MGRPRDPDSWDCIRIAESELYTFSIREDGTLLKTRKKGLRESKATVTFKGGKAFVYICLSISDFLEKAEKAAVVQEAEKKKGVTKR